MWVLIVSAISSVFSAFLAWFFLNLPRIAGSILVYLGFGFATYTFIDIGIDNFVSLIHNNLANFPINALQFIHLLGFDIYLSTILASYGVLFQIKLLSFIGKLRQINKPFLA